MLPSGLNNPSKQKYLSRSPQETEQIGQEISSLFSSQDTICLFGDLGAGKTTLVKGIIQHFCTIAPTEITSPTFSYLNIYHQTTGPVFHFDLYRLKNEEEFFSLGFEEFFEEGLCLIEWPQRIQSLFSDSMIRIDITCKEEATREIQLRRMYETPV